MIESKRIKLMHFVLLVQYAYIERSRKDIVNRSLLIDPRFNILSSISFLDQDNTLITCIIHQTCRRVDENVRLL